MDFSGNVTDPIHGKVEGSRRQFPRDGLVSHPRRGSAAVRVPRLGRTAVGSVIDAMPALALYATPRVTARGG
jgi:hypothetical protein